MQAGIYWLNEFDKLISVDVTTTAGAATTTTSYIGYAKYEPEWTNKAFTGPADFAKPIFKIKRVVETDDGAGTVTTETSYPLVGGKVIKSHDLVWDDGSSNFLNYTYV